MFDCIDLENTHNNKMVEMFNINHLRNVGIRVL